jgi:formate dehydrogenase major subunit/formate dehydrogenase alpha subunit
MTNSISHVLDNDVLFIIGSNATEAHPIIGNKMKQAALQGSKLIVVDPRRTELAEYAHLWLQLRPGTDNALVNGILHTIITNDWHDKAYIDERTEGFDALWETVKDWPAERAAEICGVPAGVIVEAAELYATTPKAGVYYTLGITEHTVGTANVMNLANLGMITGHIGFPYAGVNPMRGQNNVQGSCDMGALPNSFPGYPSVLDHDAQQKFTELYGVQMPQDMGLRIPEMFELAVHGTLKAMYIMGEDPALTDADANHVRKALENLDFLVVQNIFMTETAKYADVFLPAALYAEKDGTFTNTERRVQRVRKAVDPPGDTRPDWEILQDLGKRMGIPWHYDSPEDIFEEVRKAVPQYAGMTYERLGTTGLQWPCPTEDHPGSPYLHKGRFTRGKGLLQGIPFQEPAELTDEEYPMLLTTGRMLYHYNISTRISQNLEWLRPHELAEVNPEDAARMGVGDGGVVRVTSRRGSITTRIKVTDKVPPGTTFMTFHYAESPVNELTNAEGDPVTMTAEFKVCAVKMEAEPAGMESRGAAAK